MQRTECINQNEEDEREADMKQEDTPLDPDTLPTMHVYPMNGGLLFLPDAVVQSTETDRQDTKPTPPGKKSFIFLHFMLILCFFVLFDMGDSALSTLLTPTVTIIITPQVQTISTTATLTIGTAGADIQGRVLAPLTLSQTTTVPTTGKGHQDATHAAGALTFYNGLSTTQSIAAGTVFTSSTGVQIVTDQTAYIPQANPPQLGEASVSAHARVSGGAGNIHVGAIDAPVSTGLFVKNLAPFTGGRNARDFIYVTKADVQSVVSQLTPRLVQSQEAALTSQLSDGEALIHPLCTPHTTADHSPGE